MFCLLLDPKFHGWRVVLLGRMGAVPAFSGCGLDCWSQRLPCSRVQPAHSLTTLCQSKVLPSLRFSPQKTRVQNSCMKLGCWQQQSQIIVPVLLMLREKDGALQTSRTDPNFIERKAVLKDCKHSVVLRVLTHSVKTPFGV